MPRTARIRRSRIRSSPVSRQNNNFQNEPIQQNTNTQQDSNDDLPLTSPRLMRSDGGKKRRKKKQSPITKRLRKKKLTGINPFIFTY